MVPVVIKPSHALALEVQSNQETFNSLRTQLDALERRLDSFQRNGEVSNEQAATLHPHSKLQRMLVKSDGKLIILHISDIDWIEAWGDYVRLHCKGKTHIARQKIGDIERHLDEEQYFRISRSAIINIDRIKEMEPLNHGDYLVTLHDNTQLNLSRNYRVRLSALFDNSM
jgi:DNA-binding LytR/AlgR family response regulator